ncbi:hypothetical protein [Streptomyces sp. NPDC054863]
MTLWRQVLAALTDDTLDDDDRAAVVAHGAAQIATGCADRGQPPTVEEVMTVAFEEFALLIDADQARTALRACRSTPRTRTVTSASR